MPPSPHVNSSCSHRNELSRFQIGFLSLRPRRKPFSEQRRHEHLVAAMEQGHGVKQDAPGWTLGRPAGRAPRVVKVPLGGTDRRVSRHLCTCPARLRTLA